MKGGEGSWSWQRENLSCDAGPTTASVNPQGALELEWPFRVVLNWAKMAGSLDSCIDLSLDMDNLRKSLRTPPFGQRGSLQLRQPLKGLRAEGCLPPGHLAVVARRTLLKVDLGTA